MNRKRVWEVGAATALTLALSTAGAGLYVQRRHQAALNRSLAAALLATRGAPFDLAAALRGYHDGTLDVRVQDLVERGANPRTRGAFGWTPLSVAVHAHDAAFVDRLLDLGIDPETRDDAHRTSLMQAASGGDVTVARVLLRRGAAIDAVDATGRAALMYASRFEMVRLLALHGADLDGRDSGRRTALMVAAEQDRATVVAALLAAGADPSLKGSDGCTAAVLASWNGDTRAARLLRNAAQRRGTVNR